MTSIETPDGRRLDVQVSGPADGVPLLFHHGTPGAVTPIRSLQRATEARGLRLVTYSRAGYGASGRRPGRRVVDVVEDVVTMLDHLGAERCVTAGWSGGGPHALATAVLLPDRVAGVLTIAGVGPYDAEGSTSLPAWVSRTSRSSASPSEVRRRCVPFWTPRRVVCGPPPRPTSSTH